MGRFLPAAEAAELVAAGQVWQDCAEQGWRRIVASPEPLECLEADAARTLLKHGYLVVCSGRWVECPSCATGAVRSGA